MCICAAVVAILVLLWAAVSYNRLVRDRNLVREAWSGIDIQLKRRRDLIPAIADAVKGYRDHERTLFEEIAETRARCMRAEAVRDAGEAENALSRQVRGLFAVAEAYPELRANRAFLDLQRNLSAAEDQIQLARRYYNGTVRNYNIRVESFPSVLVARAGRFRRAEFFELEYATERGTPDVKFR